LPKVAKVRAKFKDLVKSPESQVEEKKSAAEK
jgi:hypothetical protein